jgi:hypothetical protein
MHLPILKRCGQVLIVVGALDIALMIWYVANGSSYSSSLNIFAVVGGILLVRGGLKTSRWVAALATFMLAASVLGLVVMPFMYPLGYWLAVLRSGAGAIVSLGQQVLRSEVLEAQRAAGLPPPRTKLALMVGSALPLLLVLLLGFTFRGDTAHEAIRRAEQQLGGNYRYAVTSLQMSSNLDGTSVFAIVAAYNDTELKNIQVSWKE